MLTGKKRTENDFGAFTVERRVKKPQKERKDKISPIRKKRPNRMSVFASKLGKTEIFVKGKNGVRALGAIMKICVVSDVRTASDGIRFYIPSKVCPKIVALLDNLCYDYKIIRVSGALPRLARLLVRAGLIAGIAAGVLMIALFPCFVTDISVLSLDGVEADGALNAKIHAILSEQGVFEGAFVPEIKPDVLSERILGLDGIAFAQVQRRGTRVEVRIKSELAREHFADIRGSGVSATRLATVTRVIVEGGTAQVKYGDVVKAGDLLIDGYVMYGDSRIEVEAKGSVYGTVLLKRTAYLADVSVEKVYGKTKRIVKLGMFGKAPKPPKSPFETYELEVRISDFGFLLPFVAYTYEFRQLDAVETQNVMTDEQLCSIVYAEILSELEEPASIKNVYRSVQRDAVGRNVSVTVEAEVLISDENNKGKTF